MIEHLLDQFGASEGKLVMRYFSRRNNVFRMSARKRDGSEIQFIYKKYVNGDPQAEYNMLEALKDTKVPKVLARSQDELCLEFISGPTLLEALEELEAKNEVSELLMSRYIEYLCSFYAEIPGYIYGDINFRNFIVTGNGVYGVDLEEVKKGDKAVDIGRSVAFLLMYDPACVAFKKQMAKILIKKAEEYLNIDISEIQNKAREELGHIETRRKKRVEPGWEEVFF